MKVLVTGGTGFLGKATCKLLKSHHYEVGAIGRRAEIGKELEADGIIFHQADLTQFDVLSEIIEKYDIVVHCAALSSAWGQYKDFYQANVQATQHVVDASLKHGIKKLIHISSPSICYGLEDRFDIKETDPLPLKSVNHYAATKKLAEAVVDKAHDAGLFTVTIRPQALFGPEDPAILPRLIRANQDKGLPIFHDKDVMIDITYVDNVAESIRLAIECSDLCNGKKYNITNGKPISLWPFLRALFTRLNVPLNEKRVPYFVALGFAHVLERFHSLFLPNKEPVVTRYTLGVLSNSRTLDISAARNELNYAPIVEVEAGVDRFIDWWNQTNGIKSAS